jgi:hypothetical protein
MDVAVLLLGLASSALLATTFFSSFRLARLFPPFLLLQLGFEKEEEWLRKG